MSASATAILAAMGLQVYLDGSGTLNDEFITLAAFAAPDDVWCRFNRQWNDTLANRQLPAQRVHMREMATLNGDYSSSKGWTVQSAFEVVRDCLLWMQDIDKQRMRMFYCSVDLHAWNKLRKLKYELPSPIDLCNEVSAKKVVPWYIEQVPGISAQMDFFFDSGEKFRHAFQTEKVVQAKRAKRYGYYSPWSAINVDVADSSTPGMQAADVLAWAVNRELTGGEGAHGRYLAHIMRQVIPSTSAFFDEAAMRKHFKPLIYL